MMFRQKVPSDGDHTAGAENSAVESHISDWLGDAVRGTPGAEKYLMAIVAGFFNGFYGAGGRRLPGIGKCSVNVKKQEFLHKCSQSFG